MSSIALAKVGTKNAEQVVLLDSNGDQVSSFGGGTQYADGTASATPTGTQINWNDAGTQRAVSAAKPLPVTASIDTTGLATSTKQDTIIGHVDGIEGLLTTIDADTGGIATSTASIDTKTPALGQALAAGSVPVVLTASQLSTLTPPPAITGYATSAIQTDKSQFTKITDGTDTALVTASGEMNVLESNSASIKTAVETLDNAVSGTGFNISQIGGAAAPIGSGLEATAVRVTLPTDGTGKVSVVQGTATNLKAQAENYQGGTAVGAANPLQVTLANGTVPSHPVTNAGTFAVQVDGSALTALQLIDDPVQVLGTDTYTEAASKGITVGAVRRDADTTLVNTTNEFGPLQMDANGRLKVEAFSGEALPVTDNSGSLSVDWNGTQPVTGSGNATGALRVELANNGTGLLTANPGTAANWGIYAEDAAETAGANLVMAGAVRRDTAASSSGTSGDNSTINVDALGKVWTTGSYTEDVAHTAADTLVAVATRRIDTAASSSGTSGDYSTLDSSAEGAVWATLTPTTTSGLSIFRSLDLDETEEEVKATAGNIYGYMFSNTVASLRYLKFYNATAANTTVGTTTPIITFALPASQSGHISFPVPITFATALSAAVTTGVADADTGAPGTNDVILNVFYK